MTGSFNGRRQAALVPGTGACLPAGFNATMFRQITSQGIILLVINLLNVFDTEGANVPLAMIGTGTQFVILILEGSIISHCKFSL